MQEEHFSRFKPYMHGFFVKLNMYNSLRAVANPFEFDQYRKQQVQKRVSLFLSLSFFISPPNES